ncbi:AAA family ATPase [Cognatishimia sp.]|uniref:AAA family ATPase n=1 Tax=Cognatishimia sp. TaxID=2211648 RepID=UPI003BACD554
MHARKIDCRSIKHAQSGNGWICRQCRFRIAGVESGWSSARIGEPLRFIAEQQCANPIIVINEIDKAVGGATSSSGTSTSLVNALLPLLDPHSAQEFNCPASQLVCNMSRINWILTANKLSGLSQPFLSRLELIHVSSLTEEQYLLALDALCPDDQLLRDYLRRLIANDWGNPNFSLRALARATQRLQSGPQPMLQ